MNVGCVPKGSDKWDERISSPRAYSRKGYQVQELKLKFQSLCENCKKFW